jgi:hypothetical protein
MDNFYGQFILIKNRNGYPVELIMYSLNAAESQKKVEQETWEQNQKRFLKSMPIFLPQRSGI